MDIKHIFFLTFLVAAIGCSDSTDLPIVMDDMEEEQMDSMDPIDVNTRLSLSQNLVVGENTIQLIIENDEPIDCLESITANLTDDSDGKHLEISYQTNPGCTVVNEFESVTLDLDFQAGETLFDLSIEGVRNEAKVSQDEEKFEIKFSTTDKLVIDKLTIYRIPDHIAWGYSNLSASECRDIRVSFQQTLGIPDDLILASDFAEGCYGYFEIGDLNSVIGMMGQDSYGQSMILDISNPDAWSVLDHMLEEMQTSCPTLEYFFQNSGGQIIEN